MAKNLIFVALCLVLVNMSIVICAPDKQSNVTAKTSTASTPPAVNPQAPAVDKTVTYTSNNADQSSDFDKKSPKVNQKHNGKGKDPNKMYFQAMMQGFQPSPMMASYYQYPAYSNYPYDRPTVQGGYGYGYDSISGYRRGRNNDYENVYY